MDELVQERSGRGSQRRRDRLQRLLRRRPAHRGLPGRRVLQQGHRRGHGRARGRARAQGKAGRAAHVPAPGHPGRIPLYKDIPFFARQNLRVLRNKGRISAKSIEEYIGRDGYAASGEGPHRDDPRRHHRRDQEERPARPRRRRLPHRHEVGVRGKDRRRQEVLPLQRGRGRPRRVHGQEHPRERPARRHRRHDDRRARHRRRRGLHLLPRRVPAGHRAAQPGHRGLPRVRPAGQGHPRHAASISTSRSPTAPAPSSAARRRR